MACARGAYGRWGSTGERPLVSPCRGVSCAVTLVLTAHCRPRGCGQRALGLLLGQSLQARLCVSVSLGCVSSKEQWAECEGDACAAIGCPDVRGGVIPGRKYSRNGWQSWLPVPPVVCTGSMKGRSHSSSPDPTGAPPGSPGRAWRGPGARCLHRRSSPAGTSVCHARL